MIEFKSMLAKQRSCTSCQCTEIEAGVNGSDHVRRSHPFRRLLQFVNQPILAENLLRIPASKQLVHNVLLDNHMMLPSFPSSWPHTQDS